MLTRWLIKADGSLVGVEYGSESKAVKRANMYAMHCMNQDDPYYPTMTVEEDTTE